MLSRNPAKRYRELQAILNKSIDSLMSEDEKTKYRELIAAQYKRIKSSPSDKLYKQVNRELAFIDTVIHIAIIKEKLTQIVGELPAERRKEVEARITIAETQQKEASIKPSKKQKKQALYYTQRQVKIDTALANLKLIQEELTVVAVGHVVTEVLEDLHKKQEPVEVLIGKTDTLATEAEVFTVKDKKEKPGCFSGFIMCLFPCLNKKNEEEEKKPLLEASSMKGYGSVQ